MEQFITITKNEHPVSRPRVIIHDSMWHFASFHTIEQLDKFAKRIGFTYSLDSECVGPYGHVSTFKMSHKIVDIEYPFWSLDEIPKGAKKIKALSNGSIVDCYFTNDGKTIRFYRPNPNAKDVYKPMSTKEHLAYQKIHGVY